MISDEGRRLAADLIEACRARGLTIGVAESCTGGLIGGSLTAIPGSSLVFDRGFVTYSNAAKTEVLGVPAETLANVGAVSEPVARAMVAGVIAHAPVDLAVAVTGIAGPGGGSASRPVGLVHMAAARRGGATLHQRYVFPGDRDAVRAATVDAALVLLGRLVEV
jgi:nicotinamide-nucleotide amidase